MNLPQDFKDFVQLLNENKVQYLLVGGYAVTYHGYLRFTKYIDFWVWAESKNAALLVKTLKDFMSLKDQFSRVKDEEVLSK